MLAVAAALVITAGGFLIDVLFHKAQRLLASDFYTFLVAGSLCYALLLHEARRRAALTRRMEITADVNHHIRNALTGVVFTAAVKNDPALEAVLRDATARIDWVLTTVLPDGAPDLQWPVQTPSWTPSPWRQSAAESKSESTTASGTPPSPPTISGQPPHLAPRNHPSANPS